MYLDLGETLRNSWRIGWNHRVLWLFELIPGLFMLVVFPLVFLVNPAFERLVPQPWSQGGYDPRFLSLSIGATVALTLSFLIVAALAQSVTMLGALEVERGARKLSFQSLLSTALPFFSPILGLYFLFGAGWTLILLIFVAFGSAISVVTVGLGLFCFVPLLTLVLIAGGLIGFALLELSQAAILAERLSVPDAISRAWRIFRTSPLTVLIFVFILQLGFFIAMNIITASFMSPWLLFSGLSGDFRHRLPLVFMVIFPIAMVLVLSAQGLLLVFFQSAWAVAYLRLTGKHHVQPGRPITDTSKRSV